MPYGILSPIDWLSGAKLALDSAGLSPWVTVAIIVLIAVAALTGFTAD